MEEFIESEPNAHQYGSLQRKTNVELALSF